MKNFRIMLSVVLVFVIVSMSVTSSFAIVAPEDSVSGVLQWQNKIDELLAEKMTTVSDEELIPVWVWLTDIDVDALESEIEAKTGISQQKLTLARSEIKYDVSKVSLEKSSTLSKTNSDKNVFSYLEGTKAQREELAKDTEIYLSTKKTLAKQKYITANNSKLRKLGISNDKIDFKSELTPTFIAFLTKDEIVETAKSSDVLEIGYFSEYDEDNEMELEEEPIREQVTTTPTSSELYSGLKQAIQYEEALDKYNVTGEGIQVLYLDSNYVKEGLPLYETVPEDSEIINYAGGIEFAPNEDVNVTYNGSMDGHANLCVTYLLSITKDVQVYVLLKYAKIRGVTDPITQEYIVVNAYNDIETAILNKGIDIINVSCREGSDVYNSSFSAKWFDAIVSTYEITLVASAGNNISSFPYPIAPSSGYNSISVGAYYSDTNMMASDFTYNPLLEDESRVWYKPDLIVAMQGNGGTSGGAPVVSGIVAMMMELDPSLIGQPEVVKAILMASCHEKALPSSPDEVEYMENGLTLRQGAGKVNALRALNIVAFGTFGSGSLSPQQTQQTAKRFYINSDVNTDDDEEYPINVSIAWLRHNSKTSNNPEDNQITLGGYFSPCLKVNYSNQIEEEIKTSKVKNAGKQLVFYEHPDLNKQYNIRAYWDSTKTSNRGFTIYGYAYSVGNFEKALEKIEIAGYRALGKTLTANAITADGSLANPTPLTYRWFKSTDGTNWQIISGATSSTYTLTEADVGYYLRSRVEQNYLEKFIVTKDTVTKISSILYGDVNGDGEICVLDASKLQLYLNGSTTLTSEQLIVADVDGDGIVDVLDSSLIQLYLTGKIDHFPVEE